MAEFNELDFPPLPRRAAHPKFPPYSPSTTAEQGSCRTGSSTNVDDLPDEILLYILDYLPGSQYYELREFKTLVALSRTSKRLHRLVANKIYARFSTNFWKPYLFLRTMLSNFYLAGLVKDVDITYGSPLDSKRDHIPNAQDKRAIKEGLRTAEVPNWKTIATMCNAEGENFGFLCSLIVMQARNITSLKVEHYSDDPVADSSLPRWVSLLKEATTRPASKDLNRFEHLSSASIKPNGISIRQLAPLFRIASLRRLKLEDYAAIDMEHEEDAGTFRRLIPARCNNLEHLDFDQCFVQADVLGVLIASVRRLKSFSYDIGLWSDSFDIHDFAVGPLKLLEMLEYHKKSLENLAIKDRSDLDVYYVDGIDFSTGLRNFPALRTLTCPLVTLVRHNETGTAHLAERLPPALVDFATTTSRFPADLDRLPAIERMATRYAEYTPFLKYIVIDIQAVGPRPFSYDYDGLQKAYVDTGVKIEVGEEADEQYHWNEGWDSSESFSSSHSSDEVSLYSD